MPIETKAWRPTCCARAYLTKQAAAKHESQCVYNPANEACPTCGWNCKMDRDETTPVYPSTNRCEMTEQFIIPRNTVPTSTWVSQFDSSFRMTLLQIHCPDWKPREEKN